MAPIKRPQTTTTSPTPQRKPIETPQLKKQTLTSLPQELIDEITTQIHHPTTLKSLRTLNKPLYVSATRLLFHSVSVPFSDITNPTTLVSAALLSLSKSTHARFVQNIHFTSWDRYDILQEEEKRRNDVQELVNVLGRFPALRGLSFAFRHERFCPRVSVDVAAGLMGKILQILDGRVERISVSQGEIFTGIDHEDEENVRRSVRRLRSVRILGGIGGVDGEKVFKGLRHARNLETVTLTQVRDIEFGIKNNEDGDDDDKGRTSFLHPSASLRHFTLGGTTCPASFLKTLATYKEMLESIELARVELSSGTWGEVYKEFATFPALTTLNILERGYAEGHPEYAMFCPDSHAGMEWLWKRQSLDNEVYKAVLVSVEKNRKSCGLDGKLQRPFQGFRAVNDGFTKLGRG
ncbi:hypothetical protein BJX61DRAFT_541028 [Aspergillus egyptiacus]|nr:hypothetical protein BJX61DRAFT_541028 [Aspergillus egyptiacus]